MKILIRLALLVGVLFLLGVGALAVMLPRLIQSDAVRARIADAGREATGREVGFGELDVGVLPPRLVVTEARISGETAKAEPMLEGADVELRLALLPLLARAIVVDSLVVEGATLRLVRTADGIQLPEPKPGAKKPGAEPAAGDDAKGFALAVRDVRLRGARVILEDRSVKPAVTWDLQELDATARGSSLEAPIDFQASGRIASGGRFELKGNASPSGSGPIELAATLDEVVLEPAAPYLEKGQRARGRLSGSVEARGTLPDLSSIVLDLTLAEGDVAMDDLAARGALQLKANLEGGLETPRGSFSLDATGATLRYGDVFEKPPGTPATAQGRLVTGADGSFGLEDTKLKIKNLDAQVRMDPDKRARTYVSAPPFDVDGWEALLPALLEAPPSGELALEGLVLQSEPLDVRGEIRLDGVRLKREGGAPLALAGTLVGEGNTLRGKGLELRVGEQRAPFDLAITQLATNPRLTLKGGLEQADANAWLTALAAEKDVISGPLDLTLDLATPLDSEAPFTETLTGTSRIAIVPGTLQGVSLLRQTFGQLGALGEGLLIAGRLRGGSTLQRFYGDEFKSLTGNLRFGGGEARSDDLRIEYRNYTVDLRGAVRLSDLALNMTGKLTIDEQIDAVVATPEGGTPPVPAEGGAAGETPPAAAAAAVAATARKRVIPLARVGGTLDAPKVELSPQAALEFASIYTLESRRGGLAEKIDERLGKGTGDQVIDALEGILRGQR